MAEASSGWRRFDVLVGVGAVLVVLLMTANFIRAVTDAEPAETIKPQPPAGPSFNRPTIDDLPTAFELGLEEPAGSVYGRAHSVVLQVSGTGTLQRLGFVGITPEKSDAYYRAEQVQVPWSRSVTLYGNGKVAAIFMQASAAGGAFTCTIRVDGDIRAEVTISGSHSSGVCVG